MQAPVNVTYDAGTDRVLLRIPAADGDGDVTILSLDLKELSATDRRRLRHVRPETQAQPPPGTEANRYAAGPEPVTRR